MQVHAIADTRTRLSALSGMLGPNYTVTSELLCGANGPQNSGNVVVVAADLSLIENIATLKAVAGKLGCARRRIFLIDEMERLAAVQAYALGATDVLGNPARLVQLLAKLAAIDIPAATPDKSGLNSQEAASAAAASIVSMFSAVMSGSAIDVAEAKGAGSMIASAIAENGLSDWLTTVRRHHEGTYQHCLLVTGIAVDFGLSLGLKTIDIDRLHSAAMFHDIGKAKIPLTVLDKPGRLDDGERTLIETHPATGHEVLKGTSGISAEILDVVRHHHEYLDGSGYPDAICGNSISDLVRIMTISDIFAALIEHRTYKPTMPREKAYEILQGMNGKLEKPLVEAFRNVALNR
jgi:putative nucleotidyltransferase with HDIG domain